MGGTYEVTVGDRGRLVIPRHLRESAGLHTGDGLTLIDTGEGIVLLTRDQLKRLVRADLADTDLVTELLNDRRSSAGAEDVA